MKKKTNQLFTFKELQEFIRRNIIFKKKTRFNSGKINSPDSHFRLIKLKHLLTMCPTGYLPLKILTRITNNQSLEK